MDNRFETMMKVSDLRKLLGDHDTKVNTLRHLVYTVQMMLVEKADERSGADHEFAERASALLMQAREVIEVL